jgi:geranylgeranyl pyrophosphate synthase
MPQRASKKQKQGEVHFSEVASILRLESEIDHLQRSISTWINKCDAEMHDTLNYAVEDRAIGASERLAAFVIELIHNMTLIVDDILDGSEYRRKKQTLHCKFGMLPALMTSGYIVSETYKLLCLEPASIRYISELIGRLGAAECLQWRVRGQPLGIEDWRQIAIEDTGSMFEICACLGAKGERLRKFGQLLGVLYHGCDDVADVRGVDSLGGGGDDDIRDAILTLPASIAIRDPRVAKLFLNSSGENRAELAAAFQAVLPQAERLLDDVAIEACREASSNARNPRGLITLVEYTRSLSGR